MVTQYCGNGALSDLDSGITAFNLFNTKFLEGFTLRTNIGWRDTNIADAATTRCSTSPTNGTHSAGSPDTTDARPAAGGRSRTQ